jgi:hypothetical protein
MGDEHQAVAAINDMPAPTTVLSRLCSGRRRSAAPNNANQRPLKSQLSGIVQVP